MREEKYARCARGWGKKEMKKRKKKHNHGRAKT